jgi:hypothetical protein
MLDPLGSQEAGAQDASDRGDVQAMKVIFLDFDGVLNSWAFVNRTNVKGGIIGIDPEAVARLSRLMRDTGAHVVVSSTWRLFNTLEDLRRILTDAGLPKDQAALIIDKTPRLSGQHRGIEIALWLKTEAKQPVESFVILDDDSDMADLMDRLVQTSMDHGLTDHHVEIAKRILANAQKSTVTTHDHEGATTP